MVKKKYNWTKQVISFEKNIKNVPVLKWLRKNKLNEASNKFWKLTLRN